MNDLSISFYFLLLGQYVNLLLFFLPKDSGMDFPDSSNVLLQQMWEHGHCELSPPAHPESQQIALCVVPRILHNVSTSHGNCYQIGPFSICKRSDVLYQSL